MSRSMEDDFTYFVKILDENGDRFYLKSSIDERTNTILIQLTNLELGWSGARKSVGEHSLDHAEHRTLVNQHQVRILAKQFPPEEHDSFYSHTQRAFSHGNHVEADGRQYVFNCKTTEKNRLEVGT